MKNIKLAIAFIILCTVMSCKKDEESFTTYASPSWAVENIESFPNSFTAVVGIPSNINVYASANDKVAAFIGSECRGVGSIVNSSGSENSVFMITVRGSDIENQNISFQYYNAELSYLYQANNTVAFEIDGSYGSVDEPEELDLVQL